MADWNKWGAGMNVYEDDEFFDFILHRKELKQKLTDLIELFRR